MRTEPQYPSPAAEFNLSVRTLRDEHCVLRIPAAELASTPYNYSYARNLITLFATYIEHVASEPHRKYRLQLNMTLQK